MAFFGLFNYSKPGPGVDKNGPKKKRFFLFFELYFRKFWKMIELNLLFLVCCIPIVTIGPAIAGMTYVLRNYALEKPTFMVSDFFDAFKSNWKQGFGLFTIFAAISVLAGVSFFWYFANSARSWLMLIPFGLCILLCLVLLFMQFYVYLMAVTVELKLKYIIKNAFIFAMINFRRNLIGTIGIVAAVALCFYLTYVFLPLGTVVLLFLLLGSCAFIATYTAWPKIKSVMIDPYYRETASADTGAVYAEQE